LDSDCLSPQWGIYRDCCLGDSLSISYYYYDPFANEDCGDRGNYFYCTGDFYVPNNYCEEFCGGVNLGHTPCGNNNDVTCCCAQPSGGSSASGQSSGSSGSSMGSCETYCNTLCGHVSMVVDPNCGCNVDACMCTTPP
jgi:hypothetical protein